VLRQTLATSFSRLHEPHPQRGMGAYKMIVRAPPFQMGQEVWSRLRRRPGATRQRGYSMTDGQIHPLNISSVQSSCEAWSQQSGLESGLCPQAHHVRDPNQLTPPVVFLHLPVDQTSRHLPSFARSALDDTPLATVQNGP
jgi:hypothetical protein